MKSLYIILFLLSAPVFAQKMILLDEETKEPVSYATIAFGNGLGVFTGIEGEFQFSKEKYPEIDTLYVSFLGYEDIKVVTSEIAKESIYYLKKEPIQLNEVVIVTLPTGKYRKHEIKSISHTQYHQSWLQTLESEIAVLFEKTSEYPTQLAALYFPINVKEEVQGKKTVVRKFSTMMRVKFYENNMGLPGAEIPYGNVVFVVSEKDTEENYKLSLAHLPVFIPKKGIFVSIQVLGPTDADGKLIQTRSHNLIETKAGFEKIAISFRPLLPLTNKIPGEKTFVRRVFFNDKKWQHFNWSYNKNSSLLKNGFNNYAMGAMLHVYNRS